MPERKCSGWSVRHDGRGRGCECHVSGFLCLVLNPDDGIRRWEGPYFPKWKDAVGARAGFSLKSTNKISVGAYVRFSLHSSQGIIRFVHADAKKARYNYVVGTNLG